MATSTTERKRTSERRPRIRDKAPQPGMTPAIPEHPADVRVATTELTGDEGRGGLITRLRNRFSRPNNQEG
jgi:hypothetical protein